MAQSSDRVSGIAARMATVNGSDILRMATESPATLARDIRSLAGSVLRQDETPGPRPTRRRLIDRVLGRG